MHVVPARMLAATAGPNLGCRVIVVIMCVQAPGIHGLSQDKRMSDMNGHGGSMQQAQQYDTSTQQIIVSQDLLHLHLPWHKVSAAGAL
jgi:hypothetical protein